MEQRKKIVHRNTKFIAMLNKNDIQCFINMLKNRKKGAIKKNFNQEDPLKLARNGMFVV